MTHSISFLNHHSPTPNYQLPATNCHSPGQSLVEMVVVVGIVMMVMVALVAGATIAVRNTHFSRNQSQAMQLSREVSEWLRGERERGWSQFVSHADATYCFNSLSWGNQGACGSSGLIGSIFTRQVTLTNQGNDKIEVKITTSWTDSNGKHKKEIITYFTKW